jgi:undecaprenyl-phosphate 4-deoxy-4-formamido-L-arabinose transferase
MEEQDKPLEGISVVVPVFQTLSTLSELVRRIQVTMKTDHEIILVDDGCPSHIWQEIESVASDTVRGIRLARNYGQHAAVLAGVREARYATVVTLDDDLQNPPEEIPKLLEALSTEVDVVYGRCSTMKHSRIRRVLSYIGLRLISRLSRTITPFQMTSFRAFRTDVRETFGDYTGPETSFDALLSWSAANIAIVETDHLPRVLGKSNYTFRKLVAVFSRELISYSTMPLRVATYIGLFISVLSSISLAYVVIIALVYEDDVPGFAFIASSLSVFGGVQMLLLGIIGHYIGQTHTRVMRKPGYVVRQRTPAR